MAATVSNRGLTSVTGDTPSDLFLRPIEIDWIPKLKTTETFLIGMIPRKPAHQMPRVKEEWGWGSPVSDTDQLNGAINSSVTAVTVDDTSKFQVGATFQIGTELFLTTALDETSNILTVATRPYGGSAASHSDNDSIQIMSNAIMENQATPLSPLAQGETDNNMFQQIEESLQFSHRAEVVPTLETANVPDLNNRSKGMLRRKMEWEIPVKLEKTALFGRKTTGTTSTPSSMGGIMTTTSYVTTINTGLSGVLTWRNIMDNLQTVYLLVGMEKMPRVLMAHPSVIQIVSSYWEDNRRVTGDATTAKTAFTEVDTGWFGTIKFVPNRLFTKTGTNGDVALDKLLCFNPDELYLRPLSGDSGWHIEELPKEFWGSKGAVRGDWVLGAPNPDSRLILGGFSTTLSDYANLAG